MAAPSERNPPPELDAPSGYHLVEVEDGLDVDERLRYRERQAELLSRLVEVNEERNAAIEAYATGNGYDPGVTSEWVQAALAFEETGPGQDLDRRYQGVLDELADVYRQFLRGRFPDRAEANKKTRIAATMRAFGFRTDSRALAQAVDASAAYLDEFSAYSELVATPDGDVGMRNELEGPERGRPAVVLQREGGRRKSVDPRTRRDVLDRDDERCRRCGETEDLEVHHVEPVSRGGSDAMENLATLCDGCHSEAHRALPGNGGIVPAYPTGRFEDWLGGEVQICGQPTADGGICRNAAGSCPHHGS